MTFFTALGVPIDLFIFSKRGIIAAALMSKINITVHQLAALAPVGLFALFTAIILFAWRADIRLRVPARQR